MFLGSRTGYTVGLILLLVLLLGSISLPTRSIAQTDPVTMAPGFEFNLFADPTNVPQFAGGNDAAFAGAVSMAFDARGRLFVGTYPGRILILLDNDGNGRADQVKTFATGLPAPLGLEFRANGGLFITSNVFGGPGRIIRLRDTDGDDVADQITTIVNNLPSQGAHQTDKLKFGPDGLLYFAQGSSTENGTQKPNEPPEGPLNETILP